MATGTAHYDMARYGMETFRASPRQADLMIVAGRKPENGSVLRQIYDQMMEPKWVISMGQRFSGGMFNNYAIVQGVDQVVPVDIYALAVPLVLKHCYMRSSRYTKRSAQANSPKDVPLGGAEIELGARPNL